MLPILPFKEIKNCIFLSIITFLLLSCQNVGQRNSGSLINRDAELVLQNLFEIDPDTVSTVSYTHLTLPTSPKV